MREKKLTRKEVAENAVVTLGIALSVIKRSGFQSPLTIQGIKDQIVELRETFKLIEK